MANPDHLRILHKGVKEWNAWRKMNPHVIPDLSNTNLSKLSLDECNLTEANLSRVVLSYCWFMNTDFTRANLTGALLDSTILVGANFTGCILVDAILVHADLTGANLTHANLTGAVLGLAKLQGTKVSNAIFTSAVFGITVLGGLDLSATIGLETAKHQQPSTIGVDTIFRSKGNIPEVFLRGVGVPDAFIQYAATLSGQSIEYYSCFISYSHEDKAFAQQLHDVLQSKGIRCWLDEKQLSPGDHIHRKIDEAIRLRDKVLLCCSKASLQSWWVEQEITKAINKEQQLWKERGEQVLAIIPLDLDGFLFDPQWQDWKKQNLTDRMACDFKGWKNDNGSFEREVEKVINALRADSGGREKHPKPLL